MVIPDIVFLTLVSQFVRIPSKKEIIYVERRNFEKFEQEFNFRTPSGEAYGCDGDFFSPKNPNIVFRKSQEVWKRGYNALGANSGIYISAGQFDPLCKIWLTVVSLNGCYIAAHMLLVANSLLLAAT